jgi:SpoIID/LytB domain protein
MIGPGGRPFCLLAALSFVAVVAGGQRPDPAPRERAAILVLDLPSGRTLSAVQPDLMAGRIAPGSVLEMATLIAALESGVISPGTTFTCRRQITVDGRQLVCAHPDLGRPMSPAEALALSCTDFFATIGQRVPRDALGATTTALGLGPLAPKVSWPLAALGLDGLEASPEQLLRALVRAADPRSGVRLRRETRDVLLDGLRGAARFGAARAIGERGIDAFAVTGTARMPGGPYCALTLAVSPSGHPSRAIAVLLPGGSDAEGAAVAAETLAQLIEGTYWQAEGPKVPAPEGPKVEPRVPAGSAAPKAGTQPPATPPSGTPVRVGHVRLTGGYEVVLVPLEEYVARVLAGEAAARSAPAALEALAIAVRTFAIANLGRHKNDGFDLCDLTHCQVMATSTPATRQAAAATAGQILAYRGQPAAIFYTACCGGQSELPSEVWPRAQDQDFLTRHKDAECRRLPEWTSEIAATELLRALRTAGLQGEKIRNVRVARRSASGRAAVLKFEGLDPEEMTGDDLRIAIGRTLGWQLIKSTAFDVKRSASGYRFTGHGSGHGVGLCVIGSARMAAEGKSAPEILAEYFPGTKITLLAAVQTTDAEIRPKAGPTTAESPQSGNPRVESPKPDGSSRRPAPFPSPSPPVVPRRTADDVRLDIVLPANAQRSVLDVQHLARQALKDVGGRAAVSLPASLHLVFHPTVESYVAQTKLPWWTAAATRGDRIDLLPLSLLQERQIVERTIRHEIAHVLAAPSLEGRPAWVKEGAAIYLSGERVDPPVAAGRRGKIACPTDGELLRSQSAASLHDAYARAAACYSAQIAAGRRWDEVR